MPQYNTPSAVQMTQALDLDRLKSINQELEMVEPDLTEPDPRAKADGLRDFRDEFSETGKIADENVNELSEKINEVAEGTVQASVKPFNLRKMSQMDTNLVAPPADANMGMPTDETGMNEEQSSAISFNDIDELKQLLDAEYEKYKTGENPDFINEFNKEIFKRVPENMQETVKDAVQRYFETSDNEKLRRMELLVDIGEGFSLEEGGEEIVNAPYTKASIENAVKEANEIIKNFAKESASKNPLKTAKAFNLHKEAQVHTKSMGEFLNYGPDDKRVLPYSNTGLVGSDWHTWIRARDHNFIFDDTAIDFETFWRGNVMDKYSRPYRNDKEIGRAHV